MVNPEFNDDVEIRIGSISVEGNPNRRTTPCACGSTLTYQLAPFDTSWNGKHLQIKEVWGYRCNSPNCSVTLILPEVSREIERQIDGSDIDVGPEAKMPSEEESEKEENE